MLLAAPLAAQLLSGRIVDPKGAPIPHATCFIRELSLGLAADGEGEFRAKIASGRYSAEISSLGYERQTRVFDVADGEEFVLTVVLQEKTYPMREVTVSPGGEDPAYRIMRNVIARAPAHLYQVKSYLADVYLKGTFKIEKLPALIRLQIKDKSTLEMIGKLFVVESQNEISYQTPDRYGQRVVAMSSSLPGELDINDHIPLSVVTLNIYSPASFHGLLAPGSFSVYRFSLEDSYSEGGRAIHKIRVRPKKKNAPFVNGHLYVVDDTWTIRQADLSLAQAGVTVRFNSSYHEIKPGAFLPATCDMAVLFNVMGIKGDGRFYASIKYNQLETADPAPAAVATAPAAAVGSLTEKQQRQRAKLQALADKETLTTREAYRMAQLMKKTTEPESVKEQRRNLEVRPRDSLIVVTHDSLALLRDSAYWAMHRNLPLREEEMLSYRRRDSLRLPDDSLRKRSGDWTGHLLLGHKIDAGKRFYFKYGGLLSVCSEYNFVDGFRLKERIEAGVTLDDRHALVLAPTLYYATARRAFNATVDGTLTYAPVRNGELLVSAGNMTVNFAGRHGADDFGNTIGSLFLALNTAKFYQRRFLGLSNRIDAANGFAVRTSLNCELRNDLENHTSFSFSGRTPASNRPHGQIAAMPSHNSFLAVVELEYTPRYYYRMEHGRKRYLHSRYPTTQLSYGRAFQAGNENNASFDRIEATVFQEFPISPFDRLFYEVNVGIFPSFERVFLPDFKHFRTNELFFSGKSLLNSFSLLDNYRYSTSDRWLQAHVACTSDYLLLKHLPFMQGYLMNESLHLHALWLPHRHHYEAGYSIGLGETGRIGIFAGFNGAKYDRVGFTVSLPFLSRQVH